MICWICGKPNGHADGSTCQGSKTIADRVGIQAQPAGSAR